MALVSAPEYVYNASADEEPTASALSIRQIPAQSPNAGPRYSINTSPAWPVAPTGEMVTGGPNDLGLYTLGQFQCVCIAVAIYEDRETPNWTQARLAHASSPNHPVIKKIIDTLTAENHTRAFVVIACKCKPDGNWLSRISAQFQKAVDADGVSVAPAQIWLYSTTNNATFSFGIQRDGIFGQVF